MGVALRHRGAALAAWVVAWAVLATAPARCEEAEDAAAAASGMKEAGDATAAASGVPEAAASGVQEAEVDETKQLLDKLTIAMVSEVVDGRTILIRDTAKAGKKLLRLGNTEALERGSLSEAEYEEKVESGVSALRQLVGKQMIWWKAAPDEHQPPTEEGETAGTVVLCDLWLMDGRHVNSLLAKEGHLAKAEHYQEELARNILTAASDEAKKESYKELEEAIKESQRVKAEQAKVDQARAEAEAPVEGIGLAGWAGISIVAALVGSAFFCTPEKKKKVNLNRKRGVFEKMWLKLKGA